MTHVIFNFAKFQVVFPSRANPTPRSASSTSMPMALTLPPILTLSLQCHYRSPSHISSQRHRHPLCDNHAHCLPCHTTAMPVPSPTSRLCHTHCKDSACAALHQPTPPLARPCLTADRQVRPHVWALGCLLTSCLKHSLCPLSHAPVHSGSLCGITST